MGHEANRPPCARKAKEKTHVLSTRGMAVHLGGGDAVPMPGSRHRQDPARTPLQACDRGPRRTLWGQTRARAPMPPSVARRDWRLDSRGGLCRGPCERARAGAPGRVRDVVRNPTVLRGACRTHRGRQRLRAIEGGPPAGRPQSLSRLIEGGVCPYQVMQGFRQGLLIMTAGVYVSFPPGDSRLGAFAGGNGLRVVPSRGCRFTSPSATVSDPWSLVGCPLAWATVCCSRPGRGGRGITPRRQALPAAGIPPPAAGLRRMPG